MSDPTGAEIRAYLTETFQLAEDEEIDREQALYWFAADYHGGQNSNLYSAVSTSDYRPGASERSPEPDTLAQMMYEALQHTYATPNQETTP